MFRKKISEKRNSETTEQARWWGPTREHWSSAKVEKGQSLLTGLYRGRFSNERRLQVFVVEILEAKSLRTAKKFLFVKFILRNLETLVPIPWNLGAANEDWILTSKIVAGNVYLSKIYEKNGKTRGYLAKTDIFVPLDGVWVLKNVFEYFKNRWYNFTVYLAAWTGVPCWVGSR